MIVVGGHEYGQAAEIAAALGPDVDAARVRDWARRNLLRGIHMPGQGRGTTWYSMDDAAEAEATTRATRAGRKRTTARRG